MAKTELHMHGISCQQCCTHLVNLKEAVNHPCVSLVSRNVQRCLPAFVDSVPIVTLATKSDKAPKACKETQLLIVVPP